LFLTHICGFSQPLNAIVAAAAFFCSPALYPVLPPPAPLSFLHCAQHICGGGLGLYSCSAFRVIVNKSVTISHNLPKSFIEPFISLRYSISRI
ncbi:hypothetical protein BDV93DRAFT_529004, partial [Ceratobasidium sp. AG-I]